MKRIPRLSSGGTRKVRLVAGRQDELLSVRMAASAFSRIPPTGSTSRSA
jgi:hypothetical protein